MMPPVVQCGVRALKFRGICAQQKQAFAPLPVIDGASHIGRDALLARRRKVPPPAMLPTSMPPQKAPPKAMTLANIVKAVRNAAPRSPPRGAAPRGRR